VALIDGVEYEVGPGDFMGFPTPSVTHHLKNPFQEECVYLSGGENREFGIADFPALNKRMVRNRTHVDIYPLDAGRPFGPLTDEEREDSEKDGLPW
jgi:uncharacterized cupin superfamily protein